MEGVGILAVPIIVVLLYILSSIKIMAEYERAVIFNLGHLRPTPKGPGIIVVLSPLQRMVRVSLRQEALEVPPQDIITRDNVTLKVNAIIFLRVVEPTRAVVEVSNYVYQTSQFAQTTLRSVLGELDLDELLAHRDKINSRLQTILDQHTAPWGVKVAAVEVKQVDLPETMQRAMANLKQILQDLAQIVQVQQESLPPEPLCLREMLAEIHDQSRAQRFAGDSGAGAARDQGQLVLGGVADQGLHVLLVARHGHAERLHLEDAGVGAVQRPGEFVEVQLALEEPLEVVGEPAALLIVHEPLCPRSEDPYCYWYANNWKSLAATRSASAAERV